MPYYNLEEFLDEPNVHNQNILCTLTFFTVTLPPPAQERRDDPLIFKTMEKKKW